MCQMLYIQRVLRGRNCFLHLTDRKTEASTEQVLLSKVTKLAELDLNIGHSQFVPESTLATFFLCDWDLEVNITQGLALSRR